jgi:hypothetical protein
MDERDDDVTAPAATTGAMSVVPRSRPSRPSASRRQRQTRASRSGAERWSLELMFPVSELILKDKTPFSLML